MNKIRVTILLTILFLLPQLGRAQVVRDDVQIQKDTIVIKTSAALDLLETKNMEGQLLINQSEATLKSLKDYLVAKPREKRQGYRILVYYDNDQKARAESKEIESQLRASYPKHKVYRSYSSPYFIVSIGNFKTKADAMELYNSLALVYEGAKIMKARIAWYSFTD